MSASEQLSSFDDTETDFSSSEYTFNLQELEDHFAKLQSRMGGLALTGEVEVSADK